jgi:hypothetical protein
MSYTISEETLKKTTKCDKDMKCLNNDKYPECEIDWIITDNSAFLKTKGSISCPYMTLFGRRFVCQCPTRLELYKEYEI